MRGLRIRALFVGLAALPACSLFVDLNGLSSDVAATNDASIDGSSTLDAARESAPTDDAAIDAGPSNDPCTTTHALCENFDADGGSYSEIWSQQTDQSTVDVTTDASVSAPASLRISPENSGAFGAIQTTIAQTPFPNGLKCSFAMQIDGYPPGTTSQFLDIQITTSDLSIDSYEIEAFGQTHDIATIEEATNFVDGGGNYNSKDVPFEVFDGKWHQLTVIYTTSGTPTLELDVDGTLGAVEAISPPAGLGAVVFSVGFEADDSVGPIWTGHFDNLVCDWID